MFIIAVVHFIIVFVFISENNDIVNELFLLCMHT